MKKTRDSKQLPEALAYPPRSQHSDYSRRGANAAAASVARRKRLAAATAKEKKHG